MYFIREFHNGGRERKRYKRSQGYWVQPEFSKMSNMESDSKQNKDWNFA